MIQQFIIMEKSFQVSFKLKQKRKLLTQGFMEKHDLLGFKYFKKYYFEIKIISFFNIIIYFENDLRLFYIFYISVLWHADSENGIPLRGIDRRMVFAAHCGVAFSVLFARLPGRFRPIATGNAAERLGSQRRAGRGERRRR